MTNSSRLARNIMALSVLQVMNYAVPLITLPYLARVLGPEHFGLLALAQAVAMQFDLVTDFGFNLSATRKLAAHRDDETLRAKVIAETYAAKTSLMLLCAATLACAILVVPMLRQHPWLYASAFLTVVGTVLFPVWLFQGLEKMKYIAIGHSTARLLSIPCLLFVRSPNDYVLAAAIQGSVPIVAALIVAPAILHEFRVRPTPPSLGDIMLTLRDGWHLFVSNTAANLFGPTSIVLLGFVSGEAQVGFYSAADKLIRAASAMISPLTQSLYPHLSNLRTTAPESALRLIRKSLGWVMASTAVISLATVVAAPFAGRILLGNRFIQSAAVLQLLAPLLFLQGVNNVLGAQTMMVFGLDARMSRIMIGGAVVNAILTVFFATAWGARGAAAAMVCSAALITIAIALELRRANLAVWRKREEVTIAP